MNFVVEKIDFEKFFFSRSYKSIFPQIFTITQLSISNDRQILFNLAILHACNYMSLWRDPNFASKTNFSSFDINKTCKMIRHFYTHKNFQLSPSEKAKKITTEWREVGAFFISLFRYIGFALPLSPVTRARLRIRKRRKSVLIRFTRWQFLARENLREDAHHFKFIITFSHIYFLLITIYNFFFWFRLRNLKKSS